MRRLFALLLVICVLAAPAAKANQADPAQAVARAGQLIDRLEAADYPGAVAMFSPQMAQALPADRLAATWQALPAQFGASQGHGPATAEARPGLTLVTVPLVFEHGELQVQIAVDGQQRIAGLHLQPGAQAREPAPASLPAGAAIVERSVEVPGPRGTLPATLTLPAAGEDGKGSGPYPAVVLVHGSGPQDRDETVGGTRPFLDLAHGLAQQGIAVLRYEKRTHARPQDFANGHFTVDDETTDDAVAALGLLRNLTDIDPHRLFVLGHSQGAMLAPRIAQRAGGVSGMVLWAAPARPVLSLLREQVERGLRAGDGSLAPQDIATLTTLDAHIANVRSPRSDVEPRDSPLGAPVDYWRSLEAINVRADVLALSQPVLLLQGGRDIQVTDADWDLWKQALQRRPRSTLRYYPALNHLGVAGSGPGSAHEYTRAGHVDPRMIDETARWILDQDAH